MPQRNKGNSQVYFGTISTFRTWLAAAEAEPEREPKEARFSAKEECVVSVFDRCQFHSELASISAFH
jgi:hypothetical protein